MEQENILGNCPDCNVMLRPVWNVEFEYYPKSACKTGRKRLIVDYIYCPVCGKNFTVDDTFDGPWRNENEQI